MLLRPALDGADFQAKLADLDVVTLLQLLLMNLRSRAAACRRAYSAGSHSTVMVFGA
jgi:hypothetical protein